jgi:hypothetical protein
VKIEKDEASFNIIRDFFPSGKLIIELEEALKK